jgi:two-component system KDP operon response regulator KdpE
MAVTTHSPDVVLLDLALPDEDRLTPFRTVRARSPLPIVVISARGREASKIAVLDAGADDYLTKPSWSESLSLG